MALGDDKTASDQSRAAAPRRSGVRTAAFYLILLLVNLVLLEVFFRAADFAALRVPIDSRLPYDHDPELGWSPVRNENSARGRTNSLGLPDIEVASSDKPAILFLGDSLVHGIGVEPSQRFTDRLRDDLPEFRVVNAGVVGYGTDQEYLWMRRLWPSIKPQIVVLIFCVSNDHDDNAANSRYGHTLKPYLVNAGGQWMFQGQPVPRGARWYFHNNWFASNSAIVRAIIILYARLRYPAITVPEPTNQLVVMMRDFVQSQGAVFLVALQRDDPKLEPFLQAQKIPHVSLAGSPTLENGIHWNPQGHIAVADRLKDLLASERVPGLVRR